MYWKKCTTSFECCEKLTHEYYVYYYYLFFLLSFFFFFYPQFLHLQFIFSSTSSHCLIIRFASLMYNQSPYVFDTWSSILIFTICDKIGMLVNLLTYPRHDAWFIENMHMIYFWIPLEIRIPRGKVLLTSFTTLTHTMTYYFHIYSWTSCI